MERHDMMQSLPVRIDLSAETARRRWPADVLERVHGRTGIVAAVLAEGAEVRFLRVRFDAPVCFFEGGQARTEYDFRPDDVKGVMQ